MHPDVESIIYTSEEISEMVSDVAAKVNADYAGKSLLCIGILKGACPFMMDLIRKLPDVDVQMDFMIVSSYGSSSKTSGNVKIVHDIDIDMKGMDILIVEDILDTGLTLSKLVPLLEARGTNSIEIATFVVKDLDIKRSIYPKYVGGTCPDEFVVGYGLDYNQSYRSLPYVGILKKEAYS